MLAMIFKVPENVPILLIVGLVFFLGVYAGRLLRTIRMPALMGFMLLGLLLGPSVLGLLSHDSMKSLSFITEVALGFVALTIGMELNLAALGRQGKQLVQIVLWESFFTLFCVSSVVFLLSRNIPLSLLFGAVAVTTAPAGKVAVIQENNARGKLTSTLLAVVGFDDGAAIIIFGIILAIVKFLVGMETGGSNPHILIMLLQPFIEIALSILVGGSIGLATGHLAKRLGKSRDVLALIAAAVFVLAGLVHFMHISLVFATMVAGMVITNGQPRLVVQQIATNISDVMPILFILFFTLAGAHIDVIALPRLGILGVGYILARSVGKIGGAWIGARSCNAEPRIQKYLGISLLSQAGLAIGLTLIAFQELSPLGLAAEAMAEKIIVTITATSIFFEIVGPLLTKFSLEQAGETHPPRQH